MTLQDEKFDRGEMEERMNPSPTEAKPVEELISFSGGIGPNDHTKRKRARRMGESESHDPPLLFRPGESLAEANNRG